MMKPSLQVIVLVCVLASPAVGRTVKNAESNTRQTGTTSTTKVESKMFGNCDGESEHVQEITCPPSKCAFYNKKYDVEKILKELGGLPGKVDIAWKRVNDTPKTDEKGAVIWYPDRKYWLYDYRDTDWKSYVRTEYAFRRSSGTPNEYIGVRGELYWTPPDLCGAMRYASYFVDDTGFEANISRDCTFDRNKKEIICNILPDCEGCPPLSGGGQVSLLLQSLLG